MGDRQNKKGTMSGNTVLTDSNRVKIIEEELNRRPKNIEVRYNFISDIIRIKNL